MFQFLSRWRYISWFPEAIPEISGDLWRSWRHDLRCSWTEINLGLSWLSTGTRSCSNRYGSKWMPIVRWTAHVSEWNKLVEDHPRCFGCVSKGHLLRWRSHSASWSIATGATRCEINSLRSCWKLFTPYLWPSHYICFQVLLLFPVII